MGILKKHSMLFVAATAIIGLSSFEMAKEARQTPYYWFQYDASGTNLIPQSSAPTPSANSPFGCEGGDQNCAKAFTSFNMTSPSNYEPGTEAIVDGQPVLEHRESN